MSAFRVLEKPRSIRWRPVDGAGLEHLTVSAEAGQFVTRSVVIGQRSGRPYGVSYVIVCDCGWAARTLDLETTTGQRLNLSSDGNGRWRDRDGQRLPAFDGCIDVDLAGTPFTNTLPIRRLELDRHDEAVELSMLYVPFDTFMPTIDGQRYRCLERRSLYRYEAVDRSFAADLPVDEDGFVTDYPTLFERVSMT